VKALITGGGGFLGSAIAHMLHTRGDEVIVLGRRRYAHHEQAGLATVQADIRDAAAVGRACGGVDVVFHTAALAAIWGPRKLFHDINVGGTRNVIDACRNAGVGRLVFTSSPSVVFGDEDLCGVDESQPYPQRFLAHYPETKAEAERLVLGANGPGLATAALRPHLIWGPGDPHLIPRVIERARQGKLMQVGDGTNLVDITYIDNAAEAHLLACDALLSVGVEQSSSFAAPCAGKAYFISQGEPVALWPWLGGILNAVGAPPIRRSVSYAAARWIGTVAEAVYRFMRLPGEPRMTRFLAAQLAKSHYFDISAARSDFGYVPRVSTQEGLLRLLGWLSR